MECGPLLARAERFLEREVDPSDRRELESVLTRVRRGDKAAERDLEERFSGEPRFGTAGIRAVLGAGESRMNRALVMRVTHGLVRHVIDAIPGASERGIAIGRDGRKLSDVFQRDAAAVAAALGMRVHFLEGPNPTPLLAFAVKRLGAAAGIMITASHNPKHYNGYKVYWDNGAQIVPPVDAAIAAAIDASPGASEIPRAEGSERVRAAHGLEESYLEGLSRLALVRNVEAEPLRVAYTALHGCGQRIFFEAMRRRGFSRLHPVREQAEPDPDFPTVSFPNPEEPGALDLLLETARENDCHLALAHDPDADRLGAAVRSRPGDYVVLNGNEIGVLLAHHVLSHTKAPKPLVVSSVVSSRMLSKMASALGVRYQDTLTGFKWIANEAMRIESEEGRQFVFGYEEALGYTVSTLVRDKDGIGAGLVLAEMAAGLHTVGKTLLDALEGLRRRYGLFASRQRSVTLEGASGSQKIAEAMERLRRNRPRAVELDSGNVLVEDLADGGRVAVRPSGTEPKIKFYLEVVEPYGDPDQARERAARRLEALQEELLTASGLG
jgi:phosphomannomutase